MVTENPARTGWAARLIWTALIGLLLFGVYHLVRDVLTTFFDVRSVAVDVGHRSHQWCAPVCDYVTMPLNCSTSWPASWCCAAGGSAGSAW